MAERKAIKVYLESFEGEKKHVAKFALEEATEFERILIVQNIFQVMGVESQLSEIIDEYAKIGKAYKSVAASQAIEDPLIQPGPSKLEPKHEITMDEIIATIDQETKEAASKPIEGPQEEPKDVQVFTTMMHGAGKTGTAMASALQKVGVTPSEEPKPIPEHYQTGIKKTIVGDRYQCRMHCERCGLKKTIYIKKTDIQVYCQACQKPHKVRPAKKEGHMMQDASKNFFIAGNFVGEDEKFNSGSSEE